MSEDARMWTRRAIESRIRPKLGPRFYPFLDQVLGTLDRSKPTANVAAVGDLTDHEVRQAKVEFGRAARISRGMGKPDEVFHALAGDLEDVLLDRQAEARRARLDEHGVETPEPGDEDWTPEA